MGGGGEVRKEREGKGGKEARFSGGRWIVFHQGINLKK